MSLFIVSSQYLADGTTLGASGSTLTTHGGVATGGELDVHLIVTHETQLVHITCIACNKTAITISGLVPRLSPTTQSLKHLTGRVQ